MAHLGRMAAVLAVVLWGPAACGLQEPGCAAGSDRVAIESGGKRHCFQVELAQTPAELEYGLKERREMADDHGMLFLFDRPAIWPFWMQDTYISLDIIFIGSNGRIVNIARRTTPLSEDSVEPVAPVSAVLEINGGLSDKLGIKPGDRVRHPALGTADR